MSSVNAVFTANFHLAALYEAVEKPRLYPGYCSVEDRAFARRLEAENAPVGSCLSKALETSPPAEVALLQKPSARRRATKTQNKPTNHTMSRFVAAILLSAIAVDRFVLVEARTHLTASRLLFPNELVPSSENRVVPSGPLVDHYEGDDDIVCTVSEHGALSPGCQRHTFKRAALDLRRPHAADHHPMMA